jgi:maltose alpha-D-glucosyltransferase/alpha-amylase
MGRPSAKASHGSLTRRFVEPVELDLSEFDGAVPIEMFGDTRFPPITEGAYFLSVGPHAFFWLTLRSQVVLESPAGPEVALPVVRVTGTDWTSILEGQQKRRTEALIASYMSQRRWFAGKGRRVRSLTAKTAVPVGRRRMSPGMVFVFVEVDYAEGEGDTYLLPLASVSPQDAEAISRDTPWAMLASLEGDSIPAGTMLVDAIASSEHCEMLLEAFQRRGNFTQNGAAVRFAARMPVMTSARAHPIRGEQSNTSVLFGHDLVLKIVRRVEFGTHPQVEMEDFLAFTSIKDQVPSLGGVISYQDAGQGEATVGVLERFIVNECEAWTLFGDELSRSLEDLAADPADPPTPPQGPWLDLATQSPPEVLRAWADNELALARMLGERVGELHVGLASGTTAAFQPEPFTPFSQRALAQGLRARGRDALRVLRQRASSLPESVRPAAETVLAAEAEILESFAAVGRGRLGGLQIRTHGDLHLGQVLYTGKDFVIIDFEGEPARSLGDRRLKRSPLRDVAGMLRSFHYASRFVLSSVMGGSALHDEFAGWADAWYRWVSAAFLQGYLEVARPAGILPSDDIEFARLLDVFLLEKALYELRYELDSRPDWIGVPVDGVLECLATARERQA